MATRGPRGTGNAAPARLTHGLLAGTVTPDQVRRGMAKFMPEAAVDGAFAAASTRRAAGGQALRAMIADQVASGAPGTAAIARQLTIQVVKAEPAWAAGPAVRSLIRASDAGQLRMDAAGAAVLARFFEGHGYGPEMAARLPNGLPFNITEADHDAAQLMARAGGAWHPDAPHPKPAEARVRVCVADRGFDVRHPLLATKVVPAADSEAAGIGEDTPYTHPPASIDGHGTAMVAIATGRTHVVEAVILRTKALTGRLFDVPDGLRRATEEARIVSRNVSYYNRDPAAQTVLDQSQVDVLRQGGTLLIQTSGNFIPGVPDAASRSNLSLSGEPTVLTVGGYHAPGTLHPSWYVGHPVAVHTLAPADAFIPQGGPQMTQADGTSISASAVTNLVAIMAAQAPHLAAPRLKELVERTSAQTPAWQARPSAHGMVDRARALRLAAVQGLVRWGTTDPVRAVTFAQAGGARQEREGGTRGVAPGMTAAQAADALKLTGAARRQVLADHQGFFGE